MSTGWGSFAAGTVRAVVVADSVGPGAGVGRVVADGVHAAVLSFMAHVAGHHVTRRSSTP
jgi:hypothetical protein